MTILIGMLVKSARPVPDFFGAYEVLDTRIHRDGVKEYAILNGAKHNRSIRWYRADELIVTDESGVLRHV